MNILRTLESRPLRSFSFNGLGEACTLGHGCAISHLKGIPAFGWFAWLGWRFIVLTMFVPSGTRRVRLMLDWFLTALLGRDIVNPRIDEPAGIDHALYEPGQVIVPANDTRHYHYIVETGEVQVVTSQRECESVFATLRPGDYFGHLTRPQPGASIRALTRVRLLVIDRYAADALSEVRPDLAMILKAGGPVGTPAKET